MGTSSCRSTAVAQFFVRFTRAFHSLIRLSSFNDDFLAVIGEECYLLFAMVIEDSMNIVIAPDSFKDALSARDAAAAIAAGLKRELPDATLHE